mmetsp:Transcript_1426/g.4504  ORF Transcript_1426/g.4504 Transcript_1426/m.4504 type:complete len:239 (+) Transcript_1426:2-718(+)
MGQAFADYQVAGRTLSCTEGAPQHFAGSDSGGVLWPAALPLAEYLALHADGAPSQQRQPGLAVELGCGTGLLSIAVACCLPHLRTVVATDGDAAVLQRVTASNVAANSEAVALAGGSQLLVSHLPWGGLLRAQGLTPTLILGSDLLYEPGLYPALARTIRVLVGGAGPGAEEGCRLVLGWQVRHAVAEEHFFTLLSDIVAAGPTVVQSTAVDDPFDAERAGEIRVVECTLRVQEADAG